MRGLKFTTPGLDLAIAFTGNLGSILCDWPFEQTHRMRGRRHCSQCTAHFAMVGIDTQHEVHVRECSEDSKYACFLACVFVSE